MRAVFDLFANSAAWQDWAGVKEVVVRRVGHPSPGGVGATCVMRSHGVAVESEVTHYEAPWRLRYRMVGGLPVHRYEGDLQLFERGENTQLIWRVAFQPWIPGTGPWLASMIRAELTAILARLVIYPFEMPRPASPQRADGGLPPLATAAAR